MRHFSTLVQFALKSYCTSNGNDQSKHVILSVYDNVAKIAPDTTTTTKKKTKTKNPIAAKSYTLELLRNGELFGAAGMERKMALKAQGQLCHTFVAENSDNDYLKTRARCRRAEPPPPHPAYLHVPPARSVSFARR